MSSITKESHTQHISQQFNNDLSELRSHLLQMGGLVERQLTDAVEALISADTQLAETVRVREDEVDTMELTIDEECTQIIADIERIGDEAKKIAKMAIRLTEEGKAPRGYVEARHISTHVLQMVNGADRKSTRLN